MKKIFLYFLITGLGFFIFISGLELLGRLYVQKKHVLNECELLIESQGFTPDNKKTGERRIFIMGESAARGLPFSLEESYTGYLRKLLASSGNGNVAVINAGLPGRHSFRHRYQWRTFVRYKADAVIIYSGNNDTTDFSNVIRDVRDAGIDFWLSQNSYFYSGAKRKILAAKQKLNDLLHYPLFVINHNEDDVWHWTDAYLQKKNSYFKNPEKGLKRKQQAIKDFENNIDFLASRLRKNGIEVYIVSLPIVHQYLPDTSEASQRAYRQAQDYEKAGDYQKAKAFYEKAADLQIQSPGGDSFKMKALKNVAARQKAYWIDLQSVLEQMSPHGIVGKNLFLGSAHMNSIGQKMIAAKTMEVLCETRFARCQQPYEWSGWFKLNLKQEYLDTAKFLMKDDPKDAAYYLKLARENEPS